MDSPETPLAVISEYSYVDGMNIIPKYSSLYADGRCQSLTICRWALPIATRCRPFRARMMYVMHSPERAKSISAGYSPALNGCNPIARAIPRVEISPRAMICRIFLFCDGLRSLLFRWAVPIDTNR